MACCPTPAYARVRQNIPTTKKMPQPGVTEASHARYKNATTPADFTRDGGRSGMAVTFDQEPDSDGRNQSPLHESHRVYLALLALIVLAALAVGR